MEITPWTIYLWQLADKVFTGSIVIAILCVICAAACTCAALGCCDEPTKKNSDGDDLFIFLLKKAKLFGGLTLLLIPITCLIPSSKTIAMMVIIPKIADSKIIQQDVPDLYNAAVEALKDQLKKKD